MNNSEQLTKWISGLSREKLEKIAYELTDRMMDAEEICYYPNDEDSPNAPYWDSCGIELGEDE